MGNDDGVCRHCGYMIKFFGLENWRKGRALWGHLDKAHWVDRPHKAQPLRSQLTGDKV